jgi:hypothetical protein
MGWRTAFKVIPWRDLADNAPTVVRGAKRLWGLVGGPAAEPRADPHSQAISGLDARMAALEQAVARLKEQGSSAADVISALAEQNSRLIQAVEILRLRTRILIAVCAVMAVGMASAAFVLFR